ncbi:MAG: M1 family peptidase, partial [Bacteroidota bacterium]
EKDAIRYLGTQRRFIKNESPVLGPLGVNFQDFGSSDHYYKGAWILHTLRHTLGDDPLFFGMLRSFYQDHQQSIVGTEQVVRYFSKYSKRNLQPFFDQYLKHPDVPVLEVREAEEGMEYRWRTNVATFNYPVIVTNGERSYRLEATKEWRFKRRLSVHKLEIDRSRFLAELEVVD